MPIRRRPDVDSRPFLLTDRTTRQRGADLDGQQPARRSELPSSHVGVVSSGRAPARAQEGRG